MSSARAWHVSGGGRYHASRHCPGLKNRDDVREGKGGRTKPCCTAPGFLDTSLCYAAWRRSYSSRASSGVR